jgi:hypothetical protein
MPPKTWLLTILSLATVALPIGDAGAAGRMRCTFELDVVVEPGLSASGSSGTFSSRGETGTIDCGKDGHGTIGTDGKYGVKDPDSCSSGGEGTGVHNITLNGDQKTASHFTFTYGELSTKGGVVSGTFEGDHFTGTFEFTPTEGDCFTQPMTEADVTGEGVLR